MESNILKKGTINNNDIISPSYVNLSNPKYIEIDGTFFSSLIFVNYFIEKNLWTNLENGNPGFMMGLAGIGYAVLYLDENSKKFPNILKLEL